MRNPWMATRVLAVVLGGVALGGCTSYATSADLETEDDPTQAEIELDHRLVDPEDRDALEDAPWRARTGCRDATPTDAAPIDPDEGLHRGSLRARKGDALVELPLQETSFQTLVVGGVAETLVTQTFGNPFEEPIEAVYVFPLPEDGAVDDYWIHVGDRKIRGVMKRRDEARKMYEDARDEGRAASLLEQERPNMFTQNVANIRPGDTIEVTMHVVAPLEQESGRYTLVLPTVVGPRFVPGTPIGSRGGGFAPDTDQVPDGSRITPPVLPEGVHACAPVRISVDIDTGLGIEAVRSKVHSVDLTQANGLATLELADGTAVPNRDFEISWEIPGDDPRVALMAQREDGGGFLSLTVQPPPTHAADKAMPRDLIFVVDNSGSMSGVPIETAKDAIHLAIDSMNPDDAFQVIRFSESASGLAKQPLLNTPDNRRRGHEYVDAMSGDGGTMMIEGIKAALGQRRAPGRMPIVLFLTDGYIGNEVEILAAIDERVAGARLFSLGVGSSVNRYLLDGMARAGRGAVTYMGPAEEPDAVVDRFYDRIATPVLTDIEVDWGELSVHDVTPAAIPDLFVGQPLTVVGRFDGRPVGTAIVRGTLAGERVELPVTVDLAGTDGSGTGLASLWARRRIDDLLETPAFRHATGEERDALVAEATQLALKRRVMTQFTSFVAVDEKEVVNPDGTVKRVQVPVEMPRGVSHEGVFGGKGGLVGTGRGGGGTGEGTIGLGNIGLIGRGGGGGSGSGYGRGSGGGLGGRGNRVPRVRMAKAVVTGALAKDVVRRVVRAHLGQVRHCYNRGLATDPTLAGTVVVEFAIGPTGEVIAVSIVRSTLGEQDHGVTKCLTQTIERWKFPKPAGGGTATIRYPFSLSPG